MKKIACLLLWFGALSLPVLTYAVDANILLNWQPPTENEDGTYLDDLASFRVYWGFQAGDYSQSVSVDDAFATSYTLSLPGLEDQTRVWVVVTALDIDQNESAYSNAVSFFLSEVDQLSPGPPSGLNGTIQITTCPAGRVCEGLPN